LPNSKFLDNSHPDFDVRIEKCINKLHLDAVDNLYGILSLVFKFWSVKYKIKLEWPDEVDTYSDLIEITFKQLRGKKY
jgi:hypothetical protein